MKFAIVAVLWLGVFAYTWLRAEREWRACHEATGWDFAFAGWLILGLGGLIGMLVS